MNEVLKGECRADNQCTNCEAQAGEDMYAPYRGAQVTVGWSVGPCINDYVPRPWWKVIGDVLFFAALIFSTAMWLKN